MADSVFPVIKTYGKRRPDRGNIYCRNGDVNSIFQGMTRKSVFQDSPVARSNVIGTGFGLRMGQRGCGFHVDHKAYKLGKKVHVEHTEVTQSSTSGTERYTEDTSAMIAECLGDSVVQKSSAMIVDVCDSAESGVKVTYAYNMEDCSSQISNQCPENSDMCTDASDQSNCSDIDQTTSEDTSFEDSEPSIEILRKQLDPVKSCPVQSPLHLLAMPQNSKSRRDLPICIVKENMWTKSPFCSSLLPGVESKSIALHRLDLSPIVQPPGNVINSQAKKCGTERVEDLQNKLEKTPLPLPISNSATTPCKLSKFGSSNTRKTKAACSTLLFTSKYKELENYFPCVSEVQGDDELQSQMGFGELSESFSVEIDFVKTSDKQQPKVVMSSSPCVPQQDKKLLLDKGSEKIDLFHNDLSSIKHVSPLAADFAKHLDKPNYNVVTSSSPCAPTQKMLVSETKSSKKLNFLVNNNLSSIKQIVPTAAEDRDAPQPTTVHPDLVDLTPPTEPIPLDCLCIPITAADASDETQSDKMYTKKLKQKKCSLTEPILVDDVCESVKDSAVTTWASKQRVPDNLPTKTTKHKKPASVQNSDNNFAVTKIIPKNEKKTKCKAAMKRKAPPLCSIITLKKYCVKQCQVMTYRTPLPGKARSFPRDVLLQDF